MTKLLSNTFIFLIATAIVIIAFGIANIPSAFVVMVLIGNLSNSSGGLIPSLSFESSYWLSLLILFIVVNGAGASSLGSSRKRISGSED